MLDYYLIHGHAAVEGILVEEFVRRDDFSTAGLRSSDAGLSRRVRTDPRLSARVVPATRGEAENAYGPPPLLRDYDEFPNSPTLTLSPTQPPQGFREKRLYRVLFAKHPAMPAPGGDLADGDDRYSWTLRAIGGGIAWALDVTALLNSGATLGAVLDRLTTRMRLSHGLIPVTTERLQ